MQNTPTAKWERNTQKHRLGTPLRCIVCAAPFGVYTWNSTTKRARKPTPARKLGKEQYVHAECIGRAPIV